MIIERRIHMNKEIIIGKKLTKGLLYNDNRKEDTYE